MPTTFGLKAAGWLTGILDSYDATSALVLPVQVGGAAGTMAATVELAADLDDPIGAATALSLELATALGLTASTPWHTSRSSITRLGDAAVGCTDAWGRIATDVVTLSRPEIGELSEGAPGGSSTMPHKANPVLATLVRRTALANPALASTLHVAAADADDERPAGAWHAEWDTLRTLLRRTVVAAGQMTELLGSLQVHAGRMAATLDAASDAVRAEQRVMAELAGRTPVGRLPGCHRGLHRGSAGPGCRGARAIPAVTGVRMTGAANRAELPLLVLGPSIGTGATELWSACAEQPHQRLRRGGLGPARARLQPHCSRRGVHGGRARRGPARAGRRHPGATW